MFPIKMQHGFGQAKFAYGGSILGSNTWYKEKK